MNPRAGLALSFAAGVLAGLVWRRRRSRPLETAPYVDLERYLGTWYEIARLPARFEKGCEAVTATYRRLADGTLEVVNRCRKGALDGPLREARGRARVVDPVSGARLSVSFFGPFRAPYYVLAIDPGYGWALVGTPDRRYLWILSRAPVLAEATVGALLERARGLGFEVKRVERTRQRADAPLQRAPAPAAP